MTPTPVPSRLTPQLERPSLPAAARYGDDDTYYQGEHWGATPACEGMMVLYRQPGRQYGECASLTTAAGEISDAARLINCVSPLRPFFAYIGLEAHFTEGDSRRALAEVRYPHPEQLIARLGALPLDMPRFALYEGSTYQPHTFVREMADNGRILLATEEPELMHDVIAHAITAWALLPPGAVGHIQAAAQHALARGNEEVERLMNAVDFNINSLALGRDITNALHNEAVLPPGAQTDQSTAASWRRVGIEFNNLFQLPRQLPFESYHIKEHCLALGGAVSIMSGKSAGNYLI